MKNVNLGNNLYTLRKKRGLSQEEFAEKIHISRQAVSKWERGEAFPDTENLIEIAEFYGVTLDELVNRVEPFDGLDGGHSDPADGKSSSADATSEGDKDAADKSSGDEGDEGDAGKDEKGISMKAELHFNWSELPYPIIITAAFLLLGFLVPDGFAIFWTLFITIPIYYTVVECIRKKRVSPFAYPVFCAFLYCLFGMLFGIWHPGWLIFVSIPIFYTVAGVIDRHIARKRGESVYVDDDDEDD